MAYYKRVMAAVN